MRTLSLFLSVVLTALVAAACAGGRTEVDPPAEQSTPVASVTVEPDVDPSAPPTEPSETVGPITEAPVGATEPRTLTVGGMGSEYAEPDRCVLNIGVTVRRPSVREASAAAAASALALSDALRAAGVDDAHIQTSEFSVNPFYDDWPEITGYETTHGYRVTLPDVDMVADVLAQGIDAGGDDVRAWGMRFETDPTGLLQSARESAWADVVGRAEALAALAGEPLGEVLDVHEKVLVATSQGMYQGGEGDAVHFDIPVSPGQAGVVVLLTVTFGIGST